MHPLHIKSTGIAEIIPYERILLHGIRISPSIIVAVSPLLEAVTSTGLSSADPEDNTLRNGYSKVA